MAPLRDVVVCMAPSVALDRWQASTMGGPSLQSLGQTLFSKLRGLPGERYAVCCDETYLENEIKLPAKIRLSRLLSNLQIRPPIPVQKNVTLAGGINKPLTYMLAAIHVISKAVGAPAEPFHIPENFRTVQQWLDRNPGSR
jgi:hypothetical protein